MVEVEVVLGGETAEGNGLEGTLGGDALIRVTDVGGIG